jgi:hypothetical protein
MSFPPPSGSSSSSSSLSPFSKLPLELVKQVVREVDQQDRAFKASGLDWRSKSGRSFSSGVAGGRWGEDYGNGVRSLSLVNRTLRELVVPFIFEVRRFGLLMKQRADLVCLFFSFADD